MLTRLTVVIISKYIQILNHYVVHLKLIKCYTSMISQKEREGGREEGRKEGREGGKEGKKEER